MAARFVSNHTKVTVIASYAPTNEVDEEGKNAFYITLHSATKDVPRHDILFVVGDLSAKVGVDHQYCPEALGPHGMGKTNENGFEHLCDVRGFRKVDVNSDHIMRIAKVRIKLKAQKLWRYKTNTTTHKQFDIDKLKDPHIRKNFCRSLHNRFETLSLLDEADDFVVENTWTSVKSVYHDVAKVNLGFKKRKKEELISDDTQKYSSKCKETQTLILNTSSPEQKAQLQLRYKEEDKAVKRSTRKDKRIGIERKAALA
ncbi:uncharacterized protein LOC136034469 [Artemia franciscana]|uniref:uncharacterized protein LOC136034469 n=1 Tax=Artemia franciscana TaxID=6661 RepID=UPI0032DB0CC1